MAKSIVEYSRKRSRLIVILLAFVAAVGASYLIAGTKVAPRKSSKDSVGKVEYQVVSKYSRIGVRKNGTVRTLVFVRDSGEEAYESQIDMAVPYELKFEYLKSLFLSYGVVPHPKRILIVGLGGGAMVHFLKKYDPEVHVDVVEIDPTVVQIAEKFFGIQPGKDGQSPGIFVDDGVAFIANTKEKYDVIYLDAFLKPSESTDSTGVPIVQRTQKFYAQIQEALAPGGVAAFNINPHPGMSDDVVGIRKGFPQTYSFTLPSGAGKVVIAATDSTKLPRSALAKNLEQTDQRLKAHYSLRSRLASLDP